MKKSGKAKSRGKAQPDQTPKRRLGFSRVKKGPKAAAAGVLDIPKRFWKFFDAVSEAVVIHRQGEILEINEFGARMFGGIPGDKAGKTVFDFAAPDSREPVRKAMQANDGRPVEFMARRKDGVNFPAEVVGKDCLYQGGPARLVCIRDLSERKSAEQALKDSVFFADELIKNSPDAIAVVDLAGNYVALSRTNVSMLGYDRPEEIIGRNVMEMIAPEDLERARVRFPATIREGGTRQTEYRFRRKDRGIFTGEISTAVIRDNQGNPKYVIGITRDVTEKKAVQDAIKNAMELYNAFVKASPDGVGVVDLQGKFMVASERMAEFFEVEKPEMLLGKPLFELVTPANVEKIRGIFQEVMSNPESIQRVELRKVKKDGSLLIGELSGAAVKDGYGRVRAGVGIIRDITERKKAEEAVREANELYDAFIQVSPDGVAIVDLEGKFIIASPAMARFCEVEKAEDLTGKSVFEVTSMGNLALVRSAFKGLVGGPETSFRTEVVKQLRDGSQFVGELSGAVVKDVQGRPKALVGIMRDVTERKRSVEALRESMELYQKLLKASPDAVVIVDLEGNVLDVSERFFPIFGLEGAGVLIGRNILKLVPADQRENIKALMQEVLKKGFAQNIEYTANRRDGAKVVAELNVAMMRDAYGDPKAYVGIARDVTERKRSEEALQESMELYQKLIKASPEAVVATDLQGNIVEASERALEMHGVKRIEQLIGVNAFDLIVPEEREKAAQNMAKTMREDFSGNLEYKMRRADGSIFTGELTAAMVKDSKGNPKAYIATVRDVTERKRTQAALAESEERFRTLVNSMDDVIFTANRDRKFVGIYGRSLGKYGETWTRTAGKTLEEVLENTGTIIHFSEDVREESFQRVLRGESSGYGLSFEWKGETYYSMVSLSPLRSAEGEITGIVGVVRDVTGLKRIEENLAKADKLESLGIFAGGIAHDFNNILTAIVGNVSLAKVSVDKSGPAFKNLDEAEKAATRAKNLTYQLLTFSRGGEPIKKTISLARLITDTCGFILRNSKSRLEFSIPDGLWPASVDEGQMSQVFHNLMINADQAMPNGGLIKIKCENIAIPDQNEWQLKPGGYVKISVEDQGVGIPRENFSKVFDPFFTTKRKGSGLGLTITYSIISKHDGRVTVKSEQGVGTTFFIYLPASDQPVETLKEPEEVLLSGKGKILVMDDDEGIRRVASSLLEHMGYEVRVAEDGEEAIECYEDAKRNGEPFDAVIMDLMVQQGMGGAEAVIRLHKIDPDARVIVSSGYSTDPVMSDYQSHGFVGVITKPYGIQKLKEALQKVLPA